MVVELPEAAVSNERRRALRKEARTEWAVLSPLVRSVFIGLIVAAVVAVALAILIPWQVERYLIEGEIRTITRISGDLAEEGMIPVDPGNPETLAVLDEAVRVNLLGSDVVRVKVWAPDGTITYSDEPELIGVSYPLSDDRVEAFEGTPSVDLVNLERPENRFEIGLPPLREFYVPVLDDGGNVIAVFEVYHLVDHISATVDDIRSYVWVSVVLAIGLLGLFIGALIVTNGRDIVRRQALTESLFAELVRSQADERTRIIGSLHDDIGQSLYRVHFGLEDLKSKVDRRDSEAVRELDRLGGIVKDVDTVLRAELRLLQYGTSEELALGPALDELAEVTEMESNLDVSVSVDSEAGLSLTRRIALFRAAREAVTNVRKHADAGAVQILVRRKGGKVRLSVIDDGIGITENEGLGLTTTRERLEAVGGGLRVRSSAGGGTEFVAWAPVGD